MGCANCDDTAICRERHRAAEVVPFVPRPKLRPLAPLHRRRIARVNAHRALVVPLRARGNRPHVPTVGQVRARAVQGIGRVAHIRLFDVPRPCAQQPAARPGLGRRLCGLAVQRCAAARAPSHGAACEREREREHERERRRLPPPKHLARPCAHARAYVCVHVAAVSLPPGLSHTLRLCSGAGGAAPAAHRPLTGCAGRRTPPPHALTSRAPMRARRRAVGGWGGSTPPPPPPSPARPRRRRSEARRPVTCYVPQSANPNRDISVARSTSSRGGPTAARAWP